MKAIFIHFLRHVCHACKLYKLIKNRLRYSFLQTFRHEFICTHNQDQARPYFSICEEEEEGQDP